MPRRVLDLQRQLQHRLGDRTVGLRRGGRHAAPPVDLLRPGVLLARLEAERLGHVAHRRARPVRDHVRDLGGVVAAVALVDVLDHLLSPVALDVDVDVGRAVAFGRQEPLEQQPERHRIGRRDADRVTDRRVRSAPPALAEDVRAAAELDDVPHDQEVAGEVELLDQRQLTIDRRPGPSPQRQVFGVHGTFAVPAASTLLGDPPEVLHLGQHRAVRENGARERRQLRCHQRQVERRRPADLGSPLDHAGVAPEPLVLFGPRSEVSPGCRRQPWIDLVEAPPRSHRSERRRQPALGGGGVVDVVGCHALDALAMSDLDQGIVAGRVERIAVVPQLDEHPITPERVDQAEEFASSRSRAVGDQCGGHRPLAASGEHPAVTADRVGDVGERELRRPLLAREMSGAQRPREPGVAVGAVGEDEQMGPGRIGRVRVGHPAGVDLAEGVGLRSGDTGIVCGERDLGAEHGRQADRLGRLGEADHPVEAVVIRDRQRLQAEPGGLGRQLLGMRGPVEEREVRVTVQLGVRNRRCARRRRRQVGRRLERLTLAAPRRPVASGVPRRTPRRAPVTTMPAGERRFEFAPRPRRVVEPHSPSIEHTFARAQLAPPSEKWR